MKVVHVVECFASGVAHFLNLLTSYTPECEHIIIHGEKIKEIKAEKLIATFPVHVKFIYWNHSQREINPVKDIKALAFLLSNIKKLNPDIVHLHSSKAGFLGRLACFLLGKDKVLYTPNGASFARRDISKVEYSLFVNLERFANKLSGTVVCCSNSESQIFNEIGINSIFINNGTLIEINENGTSCSADIVASDKFKVVTCGRISDQKNPQLFNEIASHFQYDDRFEFIWVGDGEPEMKDILTSKNIKITGLLPKNEVPNIVGKADLYLSTALWEGLPLAVIEAMAMSKCLLLNKCVGNVDLVKDNFNGYLFENSKEAIAKINYLNENKYELEVMGMNSLEWCKLEFDAVDNSRKYLILYRNLLNGNMSDLLESLQHRSNNTQISQDRREVALPVYAQCLKFID